MSSFNPKPPVQRSAYRWKRQPKPSRSQHYELILDGAVLKYNDSGREVCQNNAAGKREYARRVEAMCQRQDWKCACSLTCTKRITPGNATFGHTNLRGLGGSRRDDRIMNVNGEWMNTAETWECNSAKGSKR
jgi:hypothetical protein